MAPTDATSHFHPKEVVAVVRAIIVTEQVVEAGNIHQVWPISFSFIIRNNLYLSSIFHQFKEWCKVKIAYEIEERAYEWVKEWEFLVRYVLGAGIIK